MRSENCEQVWEEKRRQTARTPAPLSRRYTNDTSDPSPPHTHQWGNDGGCKLPPDAAGEGRKTASPKYSMTNKRKTEYDEAKSSLSQQTVYGRQLVFALVASLHSIGIYCGPT